MAKSPNWTEKEVNILKEIYPATGCDSKLLSLLPTRTAKSISIKSSRLGLKVINPWNKKLTTEEYNIKLECRNIRAISSYINDKTSINHKCNICEYEWLAKPNNIITNGSGCPKCNRSTYGNKPNSITNAYIYVIEIVTSTDIFIKVGVTSVETDKRFFELKSDLGKENIKNFDVLLKLSGTGDFISKLENKIHFSKIFKKYISKNRFPGYTEIYDVSEKESILKYINENI